MERLKKLVVSAGIEESDYRQVLPELRKTNRGGLVVFSVVTLVFLAAMMVLSYFSKELEGNRLLYALSAVVVGVVALLTLGPARDHPGLVLPLVYVYDAVLLTFGIVLGTVTVPDEVTATYIALILTVPQVFIDRPYRQYALLFGSVAIFIFMVVTHKDPVTWNSDIVNSIVFASVSAIACTYNNKIKVERFCLEETIRYMAQNDQLTGLKNRNSFEETLSKYSASEPDDLYCVYVDVNGLHELNNTEGHDAGDRMLKYVAESLQSIFGKSDSYRIGGDEYVALGEGHSEAELPEMIKRLRQAAADAGYHVAVGMEHQSAGRPEIDGLIKEAEKKMYADKSAYYRQSGMDRRARTEG